MTALFTDVDLLDRHTCEISWGDGSTTPGMLLEAAPGRPGTCTGSHAYQDNLPAGTGQNQYQVRISVTDDSSLPATVADGLGVRVMNVAPVISGITLPVEPILVGTEVTITATITDPGGRDSHICTISWGDGSPDTLVSAPTPRPAPRATPILRPPSTR
ncbi:MAG: hypothetical protein KatS3mg057_1457 [Herpetosiphonaceae bacterium]|nr:MAG: hypothetical protein KatS3mg057_1457 [Herpetosiphonaceae bacterium]